MFYVLYIDERKAEETVADGNDRKSSHYRLRFIPVRSNFERCKARTC